MIKLPNDVKVKIEKIIRCGNHYEVWLKPNYVCDTDNSHMVHCTSVTDIIDTLRDEVSKVEKKNPYACCKNCIHYELQLGCIHFCKFNKGTINPFYVNDHCKHFVDKVERLPI